jgi:hypothetical protein
MKEGAPAKKRTRRRSGPKTRFFDRERRRWTAEESRVLQALWGTRSVTALARRLGRTPRGVSCRAVELGLRSAREELWSWDRLARETGYGRRRLQAAALHAGVKVRKHALSGSSVDSRRQGTRATTATLSGSQVEAIVAFLATIPDGQRLFRPGRGTTPPASWGTGGKPAACTTCHRTDSPHHAQGECRRCYGRRCRRRTRRALRRRQQMRDLRAQRDAASRCQVCAEPAEPGGRRCVACREAHNERTREARAERIQGAVCVRCPAAAEPGHRLCGACREKERARHAARRARQA